MPKIRPSGERIPIPKGDHILTLREVKDFEQEDKWHENEDGSHPMKHQLIWRFESDALTEDGVPYEYAQFTGQFYGDSRANLTALLDFLLPDEGEEYKKTVDTDTLIGKRYKVRIASVKNQAGKVVPKAMFYEPLNDGPDPDLPFDPEKVPA